VPEQNISAGQKPDLGFEIAHILLMDVVGYSQLLGNEQAELLQQLNQIVRNTECFRRTEASRKLIRLPTGDGMALLFFHSPEEPVRCALEIAEELRSHPQIQLRIGIHSGPVNEITDVNDRSNITGAGINIAQRVMDCGDAGHILLSKHVADDLAQYEHWRPWLHDLGECEVKHGLRLHVFNLAKENIGNLQSPQKFKRGRRWKQTLVPEIRPVRSTRWREFAIVAAILLSVAIAVGFFIRARTGATRTENSIAVLPFLDLSQAKDQEYFSDGITEQITTSLAEIHGLFVVARTSAFAFKNKTEDVREIGRRLHVQHVLEGSVSRSSGKVRIDAQLISVSNGYHIWAQSYDSNEQDILALQSDVAEKVASALRIELHLADAERLGRRPTVSPEAYELYLRGRYLLNKRTIDSIQKARALFEQAVAKDPRFALGRTGIADSYILLADYGEISPEEASKAAWPQVSSAIAIDDNLAEAHLSRALLLSDFEWNWRDAEIDYRKAIQLNPNSATAHHWYAFHLAELGRFEEALRQIDAAQKQDPLSPIVRAANGKILYVAHRYDQAIKACQEAMDLEPNFAPALFVIAQAYSQTRQYPRAIEAAEKYTKMSGPDLELAYAYAAAGMKTESERIVREVTAQPERVSSYDMATVCLAWHDDQDALQWLEKAISRRSLEVIWIRVDPRLDDMRTDGRFQKLVSRVQPHH
jgi:TolB-like protein/class 3 adenylate cyclase